MIVIPMAGLSRRFTEAGYTLPKYMLEAKGQTLFEHSVLSFEHYFEDEAFLFIARDVADTRAFIERHCAAMGIKRFAVTMLNRETRGQAETVALGVEDAGVAADAPITIFNIDTFRPGFRFPEEMGDGYLETFIGSGANWSYVKPAAPGSDRVVETREKQPISEYCCTGLYHFSRAGDFMEATAAEAAAPRETLQGGELYVAPLYNRLIAKGADIRFTVVPREEIIFCGVPAEYDAFLAS
jgi:hypothetical protein